MPALTRKSRKLLHVRQALACKEYAPRIGSFVLTREDTRIIPQGSWPPADRKYLTLEDAVRRLSRFLLSDIVPGSPQHHALLKLKELLEPSTWSPDRVLGSFRYMDIAFFDGCLLQDVKVGWHSFINGGSMYGVTLSWYQCADQKMRVWVLLNINSIFDRTHNCDHEGYIQESWQTLVHELTHAYLEVVCGSFPRKKFDEVHGWDSMHGYNFKWLYNIIDRLFRYWLRMPACPKYDDSRICLACALVEFPFDLEDVADMWNRPIIQQDRAVCNKKCNWHLYWRSGKDTEEQKELDRDWISNTKQIEMLAKKLMVQPELRLTEEERATRYPVLDLGVSKSLLQAPKLEHFLQFPSAGTQLLPKLENET